MLQEFTVDPNDLKLIAKLSLAEDMKSYFAKLIEKQIAVTGSIDFIPDTSLCFVLNQVNTEAINGDLSLKVTAALQNCNSQTTQAFTQLTTHSSEQDSISLGVSTLQHMTDLSTSLSGTITIQHIPSPSTSLPESNTMQQLSNMSTSAPGTTTVQVADLSTSVPETTIAQQLSNMSTSAPGTTTVQHVADLSTSVPGTTIAQHLSNLSTSVPEPTPAQHLSNLSTSVPGTTTVQQLSNMSTSAPGTTTVQHVPDLSTSVPGTAIAQHSPDIMNTLLINGTTSATPQHSPDMNASLILGTTRETSQVTITVLETISSTTVENIQPPLIVSPVMSTTAILEQINGSIIQQNLQYLSQVSNWTSTQATAIVQKLLDSGYQANTSAALLSLGHLAVGIPSKVLQKLNADTILQLATNTNFTTIMAEAPEVLKYTFVQKLITITNERLESVPDNLADEIPLSKLFNINVSLIYTKKWTVSQASILFYKVITTSITSMQNFSWLSTNLLQGFTCGTAITLTSNQINQLIQVMKVKDVTLSNSQAKCMARILLQSGSITDISKYPSSVLLYFSLSNAFISSLNCTQYVILVGNADAGLLINDALQTQIVLQYAKQCLGISGSNIAKQKLQILNNLVCGFNGTEIAQSDLYILTLLQNCISYTTVQVVAIQQKLQQKYGDASSWNITTLRDIGGLNKALTTGIISRLNQSLITHFFPSYLRVLKSSRISKTQYRSFVYQLSGKQLVRRSADCPKGEITTDAIQEYGDLLVSLYPSASEIAKCLTNDVLKDNLEMLGSMPFQNSQLDAIRENMDKVFNHAVPEQYLPSIGNIARMYSVKNISNWNITKVETLGALLEHTSWDDDLPKVNAMFNNYLASSGASLDGLTLALIAPYFCSLNTTQINQLTASAVTGINDLLNISACSQAQKNLIYEKTKEVYSGYLSSGNPYYEVMKSLIAGAKAEDLMTISSIKPSMDIGTFAILDPNEVQKLSATHLKNLVGVNLQDMRSLANDAIMSKWIRSHRQSEVDTLGLGFTGGIPDEQPVGLISFTFKPPQAGASTCYRFSQNVLSILLLSLTHVFLMACF
ncbi:mucin-4-like [Protopterus annectens]|uniref:mucin-4-like n=1 Tax=Protopterus annectens TaxID=7888 RepID=UPI001CF94ACC|nr:mucin-4-like [Protopterus annectens]